MSAWSVMEIYVVRHGETDWNRAGGLQGTIDTPLNWIGVAQARHLADRFSRRPVSSVVTSPLARARSTALAIARASHSAFVVDPLLAEIDHGSRAGPPLPTTPPPPPPARPPVCGRARPLAGAADHMTPHRRAIGIAGPASGVGKTTIALGLMAAFRRRGLVVQPFKCGPDFIDAGHHTRVCERPSRNLDAWMLPGETNRAVLAEHTRTADVAIVEGVMGLFDGARHSGEGSTAELAKLLRLPILFVGDASKMGARAAAP